MFSVFKKYFRRLDRIATYSSKLSAIPAAILIVFFVFVILVGLFTFIYFVAWGVYILLPGGWLGLTLFGLILFGLLNFLAFRSKK